jgi:hypothetical protein
MAVDVQQIVFKHLDQGWLCDMRVILEEGEHFRLVEYFEVLLSQNTLVLLGLPHVEQNDLPDLNLFVSF